MPKDYIDAKFSVVRPKPRENGSRWLVWLAMTAFMGLLAAQSAADHTRPVEPPASHR